MHVLVIIENMDNLHGEKLKKFYIHSEQDIMFQVSHTLHAVTYMYCTNTHRMEREVFHDILHTYKATERIADQSVCAFVFML